jgi:hypothetical protein
MRSHLLPQMRYASGTLRDRMNIFFSTQSDRSRPRETDRSFEMKLRSRSTMEKLRYAYSTLRDRMNIFSQLRAIDLAKGRHIALLG